MKLTVDLDLNPQPAKHAGLTKLLSKATISTRQLPLEALVSEQFLLPAQPDYPLGAISANADGVAVENHYWLRADPVHLVLQRDSFSLGEQVPLRVAADHTQQLLTVLNHHFAEDGLQFYLGHSGAWYLRWPLAPDIRTNLPSSAIGRNIHGFMPQGAYASKWLTIVNEIQMLLFEHPVNQAREASGLPAVNSVWISGGGILPPVPKLENSVLLVADTPMYIGLAKWAGLTCLLSAGVETILGNPERNVRLHLDANADLDGWLSGLYQAMKTRKVKEMVFNIGLYDQCVVAELKAGDLYRFWRNNKVLESFTA
jgi:hypothetical protein